MGKAKYEVLAKYRSGWTLIAMEDGRQFLRRAYQGQYAVKAVRSGLIWIIHSLDTGERVNPSLLR